MRTILYILLMLISVVVNAAVPQLTDFNTNQFVTVGGIVTIKNGALVTNLVGAGGSSDWTNNAGVVQLTTSTNNVSMQNHAAFKDGVVDDSYGFPFPIGVNYVETLTTNASAGHEGIVSLLRYKDAGDLSAAILTGIDTEIFSNNNYDTATNNANSLKAYFSSATWMSTGTVHRVYGGFSDGNLYSGTIDTSLIGQYSEAVTSGGTLPNDGTSGSQSMIQAASGGIIPTGSSFRSQINVDAGTITNAVAFRAPAPEIVNGGTIQTFYGLKVDDQQLASTNYAIYTGIGRVLFGDLVTTVGGRVINRFATATNYTLTVANHYLVSTATQTNTLPAANAVAAGQIFIIKNKSGTTTVRPAGADTIDGVAADDVLASKASNTYISDGVSNWEKN